MNTQKRLVKLILPIGALLSASFVVHNPNPVLNTEHTTNLNVSFAATTFATPIYDWSTDNLPLTIGVRIAGLSLKAANSNVIGLKSFDLKIKNGRNIEFNYGNHCNETLNKELDCMVDDFNLVTAISENHTSVKDMLADAQKLGIWKPTKADDSEGRLVFEMEAFTINDKQNGKEVITNFGQTNTIEYEVKENVISQAPVAGSRPVYIEKTFTRDTNTLNNIMQSFAAGIDELKYLSNAKFDFVKPIPTEVTSTPEEHEVNVTVNGKVETHKFAVNVFDTGNTNGNNWEQVFEIGYFRYSPHSGDNLTVECMVDRINNSYALENLAIPTNVFLPTSASGKQYRVITAGVLKENGCAGLKLKEHIKKVELPKGMNVAAGSFKNMERITTNQNDAGVEIIFNDNGSWGNTDILAGSKFSNNNNRKAWTKATLKGDTLFGQNLSNLGQVWWQIAPGPFDTNKNMVVHVAKTNTTYSIMGTGYDWRYGNSAIGINDAHMIRGELKEEYRGYTWTHIRSLNLSKGQLFN